MIRRVERDELHKIETLIRDTLLLSNAGSYPIEEVESLIRTYSESSLVAMTRRAYARVHATRNRLDGFLCLDGETLQALFVAPDAQRKGIGTALVSVAEERAIARGREHLRVPASLTAVPFYEYVGFVRQGPGRTAGDVPVVWMIKPISTVALRQ